MIHIREIEYLQFWEYAMYHIVIKMIFLIAEVEHRFVLFREKHMRTYQYMIGVNTEIMTATANLTRQLNELLEEPSAPVPPVFSDDIETHWRIPEDGILINKNQTVCFTESQNLLLRWCYNINILYMVGHTMSYAIKT